MTVDRRHMRLSILRERSPLILLINTFRFLNGYGSDIRNERPLTEVESPRSVSNNTFEYTLPNTPLSYLNVEGAMHFTLLGTIIKYLINYN